MTTIETPAATAYEYRTVCAGQTRLPFVKDMYASFGWVPDWVPDGTKPTISPTDDVTFAVKRDRHINNRPMVAELQRKAEAALAKIDQLERSETRAARIVGFAIGILGTAALAVSIYSFFASLWAPFVILGVVGLIGWVTPYFAARSIRTRTTARVAPLIDQAYDTVYAACDQAQELLAQSDQTHKE